MSANTWDRSYPFKQGDKCPLCSVAFFKEKSLRSHVIAHDKQNALIERWTCSVCQRSIWSLVRTALKRCNASIDLTRDSLTCASLETKWGKRDTICRQLRNSVQQRYLSSWKAATDQGRSATCVSAHTSSNHWIRSGKYTSFGEYHFALKAGLNLLPTLTVRRRAGERLRDVSCRNCREEQETLAHVLNHCPPKMGLLRMRRNKILSRLSNAILVWKGRQFKEQCVPGDTSRLKPDLVILNETSREAYVVDVTMPFEDTDSFREAWASKERKYGHLKALLSSQGFHKMEVDAFIVGPLGSWDPENEPVLRKLSIGRNYARLFRQLCCSEAIKGSFHIWKNTFPNPDN
eukprot:Em0007g1074a